MKLLVLSFYYPPDLSAGSFRAEALINALLEQLPDDAQVDLITSAPNRYHTYAAQAPQLEKYPRLSIRRVALPAHSSAMLDQSKAFLAYARGVLSAVRGGRYDLICATSSRLMTAALGAVVARRHRTPLYLDIRDIFVDTIADVLPGKLAKAVGPVFSLLERWTIGSAVKINLVSAGFLPYFNHRYASGRFSVFTNGIDPAFIHAQPVGCRGSTRVVLKVLYAGNMGEGQGLHVIIPALAKQFASRLTFVLIGDGGRRRQLAQAIAAAGLDNVELRPPVGREELIAAYQDADILFVHLNDYDAFRKVLPSKLFEYAAMGKPVWAGVAGYAAEFVRANISNAAVFSPCNAEAAARAFSDLRIVTEPRSAFVERFSRISIMRLMASDILAQVRGP